MDNFKFSSEIILIFSASVIILLFLVSIFIIIRTKTKLDITPNSVKDNKIPINSIDSEISKNITEIGSQSKRYSVYQSYTKKHESVPKEDQSSLKQIKNLHKFQRYFGEGNKKRDKDRYLGYINWE